MDRFQALLVSDKWLELHVFSQSKAIEPSRVRLGSLHVADKPHLDRSVFQRMAIGQDPQREPRAKSDHRIVMPTIPDSRSAGCGLRGRLVVARGGGHKVDRPQIGPCYVGGEPLIGLQGTGSRRRITPSTSMKRHGALRQRR